MSNTNLQPDTYRIQQAFSSYCRTGKKVAIPGANGDRMQYYRQLVFNVINDAMESAFPVAFANMPKRKWNKMIREFFSNHACCATQMWKLPLEFYTYAVENNWNEVYETPWLLDLLYFEWSETELFNMADKPAPDCREKGHWKEDLVVLNPEHTLLSFKYPVHLERKKKQLLQREGTYFVLLFREPDTGYVQFTDLSAWLAIVIEQLSMGVMLSDILDYALQLNITVTDKLEMDTIAFLEDMRQRKFVFGFK
ncbi:DUF2063 domain-containing protein [Chitinophaga sp. Hz27]|uniref:HvfC/BufC N-terminal domain-containing protein n=1 Tax=Chitinophaga sp. Hz27 TaxID=3347169 RepID=UPI0035DC9EF1